MSSQLAPDALTSTAKSFGIGLDFVIDGITTLTGKVPIAPSVVQRAENGFGQGTVLITPFSALLMAAAADKGELPTPVLIRGSRTTVDQPAPARSAQVQQDIQTYMRAVVTEGTATNLIGFGDVHAKTGTAEFVADDGSLQTHAWNLGYLGDFAYAAFIDAGGDGSFATALVYRFLEKAGPW